MPTRYAFSPFLPSILHPFLYFLRVTHWESGNPTRVVFASACRVMISLAIPWPANGTGYRYVWIKKNGTTNTNRTSSMVPVSSDTTTNILVTYLALSAGDYIEVMAFQDSGSPRAIGGQSGEVATLLVQHI